MPYPSAKELPPAVKKLGTHQQSIWRAAFNNALKQYGSEEKAFKVAWAAVAKHEDMTMRYTDAEEYKPKSAASGSKGKKEEGKEYEGDCCDKESDAYDPEECKAKKAKAKQNKDGERHQFDAKLILDKAKLRVTNDGYLVASARVARTGIQMYGGNEIGDEAGRATVRVYRPEAEVFDNASLHTFAHKPVTLHHPSKFVSADNWKDYAVGHVDGEIMRDGDTVRIPMLIMDAKAIRAVREGVQELSVGYDANLDWTPGLTDSGEEYDAVQRGIRVNHIALTPVARGGPLLRLGDEEMDREVMTKQIVCDGITITLPQQDAQIVTRALSFVRTEAQQAQDALAPAQAEVARLTRDNQTLAGKVAALEQQVRDATVTDADLDRRVTERQALITQAKRVLGEAYKADGKTSADIRREAVTVKLGDVKARTLSDTAIEGAFEAITVETTKDGLGLRELGQALSKPGNPPPGSRDDVEKAWEERGRIMREAWKTNNGSQVTSPRQ